MSIIAELRIFAQRLEIATKKQHEVIAILEGVIEERELKSKELKPEKIILADLLTKRETEIFELLGRKFGPAVIAAKLKLSQKTIEEHRNNIRKKMGFKTSEELTNEAIRRKEII